MAWLSTWMLRIFEPAGMAEPWEILRLCEVFLANLTPVLIEHFTVMPARELQLLQIDKARRARETRASKRC